MIRRLYRCWKKVTKTVEFCDILDSRLIFLMKVFCLVHLAHSLIKKFHNFVIDKFLHLRLFYCLLTHQNAKSLSLFLTPSFKTNNPYLFSSGFLIPPSSYFSMVLHKLGNTENNLKDI